jgi:hypothetical protein
MFVNSKTFMELVQLVTRLETKVEALEGRIKTVEERPIAVYKDEDEKKKSASIFEEMLYGEVDPKLGRVRYTDGTD